jgi:hypothetical protein
MEALPIAFPLRVELTYVRVRRGRSNGIHRSGWDIDAPKILFIQAAFPGDLLPSSIKYVCVLQSVIARSNVLTHCLQRYR